MISQNPGDVSLEDPNLAPTVAASRSSSQRSFDRDRAILAEHGSATGTETDAGLRSLMAERGQREQAFEAGLVREEVAARREELQTMMALSWDVLGEEERIAATRELAHLDRLLEREVAAGEQGINRELGIWDLLLGNQTAREGLGVERERTRLETETDRSGQALERELGLWDLILGNQTDQGDLALRRELGLADINLRQLLGLEDVGVRREGIASQERLGGRDIDLRGELGRGGLALGLLEALLNDRYRNTSLGVDIGQFISNQNRNSWLDMMGGN